MRPSSGCQNFRTSYGVDTATGTGRLGIELRGVIDALLKVIGGMSIRYTKRTLACWTGLSPCIEGYRYEKCPVKMQMSAGRDVLNPGGQPSFERVTV